MYDHNIIAVLCSSHDQSPTEWMYLAWYNIAVIRQLLYLLAFRANYAEGEKESYYDVLVLRPLVANTSSLKSPTTTVIPVLAKEEARRVTPLRDRACTTRFMCLVMLGGGTIISVSCGTAPSSYQYATTYIGRVKQHIVIMASHTRNIHSTRMTRPIELGGGCLAR